MAKGVGLRNYKPKIIEFCVHCYVSVPLVMGLTGGIIAIKVG